MWPGVRRRISMMKWKLEEETTHGCKMSRSKMIVIEMNFLTIFIPINTVISISSP